MIRRIYLNRDWVFRIDKKEEIVTIPHTVKELPYNYLNENDYQMISTYSHDIKITKALLNKHLFLTFDGVLHSAPFNSCFKTSNTRPSW